MVFAAYQRHPPKLLGDVGVIKPHLQATQPSIATTIHTPEQVSIPIVASDVDLQILHQHPFHLFQAIQQSRDKLFFVSFRPEGTLRARWYLVSVDLCQTEFIIDQHGTPDQSGIYYAHFLA